MESRIALSHEAARILRNRLGIWNGMRDAEVSAEDLVHAMGDWFPLRTLMSVINAADKGFRATLRSDDVLRIHPAHQNIDLIAA